MKKKTSTGIAAAMVLALALPACQTTGSSDSSSGGIFGTSSQSDSNLTPAERRLRADNDVFNETIFGGAVSGAVKGAIIGGIFGLLSGDLKQAGRGAAIGAGVGAVAGTIDGYLVAVRQEAARKRVREIEVVADEVEAENARIEQSIQNMDIVIAQTRRDIELARADHAAGRISLQELRNREVRARRNVDAMDDLLASMEKRTDQYDDVTDQIQRDGVNTAEVDREIDETKRLLASRKEERDLLVDDLDKGTVL